MRQRRGPLQVRPLVELATGLALLASAVATTAMGDSVLASTPTDPTKPPRPNTVSAPPDAHPSQGPDTLSPVEADGAEAATDRTPLRPERIRIHRLGVDAPVVDVDMGTKGSLDVPSEPQVLGWWADGALPGADRGTAIIAGHVNTAASGPGALFNLNQLDPGDEITVSGSGQELRFRVVTVEQYHKSQLPASTAFSQNVDGRLAIVSCGGPFNAHTGHYRDNLIAYAIPV